MKRFVGVVTAIVSSRDFADTSYEFWCVVEASTARAAKSKVESAFCADMRTRIEAYQRINMEFGRVCRAIIVVDTLTQQKIKAFRAVISEAASLLSCGNGHIPEFKTHGEFAFWSGIFYDGQHIRYVLEGRAPSWSA